MTEELPGQMVLFGVSDEMAQAVRDYAVAYAERFWQHDQGYGSAVLLAENQHRIAVQELERLGYPVDDS